MTIAASKDTHHTALRILRFATGRKGQPCPQMIVPSMRRRMAKLGKDGEVKILLDDYPYAEDGLLIWSALKRWNDGYLVGSLSAFPIGSRSGTGFGFGLGLEVG